MAKKEPEFLSLTLPENEPVHDNKQDQPNHECNQGSICDKFGGVHGVGAAKGSKPLSTGLINLAKSQCSEPESDLDLQIVAVRRPIGCHGGSSSPAHP